MLKFFYDIINHKLSQVILGIILFALFGALLETVIEGNINAQFSALGDAFWWVLVTMTTVGSIIYHNIATVLTQRLIKSNKDILKLTTAFSLALEGD